MKEVKKQLNFEESVHALFSHERREVLDNQEFDSTHAITKWRSRVSMNSDSMFQIKLKNMGLTENIFGEGIIPLEELKLTDEQVNELQSLLKTKMNTSLLAEGFKLSEMKVDTDQPLDLGFFIHPFLVYISDRLDKMFESIDAKLKVNRDRLKETLLYAIGSQLLTQASRSIVLEMHISKLKDELYGETGEERFQSFIREKALNSSELLKFYEEYATLCRILTLRSEFFLENTEIALRRYAHDFKEMSKKFNLKNNKLEAIEFGLGDTHQKGKTVGRFVFDDGKTIIYKPKGLSISIKYHNLLQWIADRAEFPTLKPYKILDFETHGWEECVPYKSCNSEEEVKDYYRRFGVLLGLMHSIKGADFHLENIIASGDTPFIIDHETLFHQSPKLDLPESVEVDLKYEQANSVVGTGLLPFAMFKNAEGKGVDLSALNGKEQDLPFKVLQLESNMTDDMKYTMQSSKFYGANNLTKLNDEVINSKDYVEDILTGFEDIFRFFMDHKVEILKTNGPLEEFKGEKIRVVARATQQYFNFLNESSHPDYMRDALYLENLFDRLWFYPYMDKRIVPYEIADLLEGDIPFFNSKADSTDLFASNGKRIPNVFAQSGYALVIERIEKFNEDELKTQLDWIRTSIAGVKEETSSQINWDEKLVPEKVEDQFLSEAKLIGDEILSKLRYSNIKGKLSASLLCLVPSGEDWTVAPATQGLYEGLGGISFFFQYLYKETKEERYKEAAEATLRAAISPMNINRGLTSAFSGDYSLLYPIIHFHKNFRSEEFKWKIDDIKNGLRNNVQNDETFDYLGGAAGVAHLLMNAYEWTGDQEYLEIADLYGEHLVAHSHPIAQDRKAWPSNGVAKYLGGLSHGTSGIAQTLYRLSLFTSKSKYVEEAEAALNFDQSLFNVNDGAWQDNRDSEDTYVHNWCHGSNGIGLSRIVMSKFVNNQLLEQEARQAINNIRGKGYSADDSLCHGNFGDTELLIQGSIYLNDDQLMQEAKRKGYNLILQKEARGIYQVDGPKGFIQPSLFTGLSGVGYQLLRLSNPQSVPAVLLLA